MNSETVLTSYSLSYGPDRPTALIIPTGQMKWFLINPNKNLIPGRDLMSPAGSLETSIPPTKQFMQNIH